MTPEGMRAQRVQLLGPWSSPFGKFRDALAMVQQRVAMPQEPNMEDQATWASGWSLWQVQSLLSSPEVQELNDALEGQARDL